MVENVGDFGSEFETPSVADLGFFAQREVEREGRQAIEQVAL